MLTSILQRNKWQLCSCILAFPIGGINHLAGNLRPKPSSLLCWAFSCIIGKWSCFTTPLQIKISNQAKSSWPSILFWLIGVFAYTQYRNIFNHLVDLVLKYCNIENHRDDLGEGIQLLSKYDLSLGKEENIINKFKLGSNST